MATILPSLLVSLSALRTPLIEPSLAPKKPFRFGWAVMIALARSADLTGSPAPYWMSTTWMFGYLALISLTKPSRRVMPVWLVWSWTTMATSPEPPIAVVIWSAAVPAAAMLSVASVVTGIVRFTA